jgi:hypothetical protein
MSDSEIKGGATLWARQTINSKIFSDKPAIWFKIWFYLVNKANHKKIKNYERGESFFQQSWICEATKATPDQVKKCLKWLRKSSMIRTKRSTKGTKYEIANYSLFQSLENYYNKKEARVKAREKHERSTKEARRYTRMKRMKKNNIASSPDDAVNKIFNLFYESINPGIVYGNKTNREAVRWFIRQWGEEQATRMFKQVIEAQQLGDKYCPVATTPHQVKLKLGDFQVYFKKKRNNLKKVGFVS